MRFPGFEGVWEECILGGISSISKGAGISKDQLSKEGKPCILYGELYTKYKSEVINNVLSRTDIDATNLVKSNANDVIIPSSGESSIDISTACCVPFNGILLGGDLNIIRLYNGDGRFFSYQLNGKRKYDIAKVAQGVSVVHLYGDGLKKLKVYYPTIEEQHKIASLLSLIDERISTQSKIIEYLKSLKTALSKKIFSRQLRFKDENGNSYPDWKMKKLGEVCIIIMGQSPSSTSYNTDEIGIPLIQGNADIVNRITSPRNWTTEITKECKIGDLILTVRAPVGAVAKSLHNACIGRGVCAISTNSKYSIEFIYQYLLHYEDKWSKLEQGSTFTAISGNEIKKLEFNMSCIEEQNKIAKFLHSFDAKIETEKRVLERYQKQKQFLLKNMFV